MRCARPGEPPAVGPAKLAHHPPFALLDSGGRIPVRPGDRISPGRRGP
jgi:hypothetical protein